MVGGSDLLLGVLDSRVRSRNFDQRHFHVRLARTDPHFAEQDVVECDAVASGNGDGVRAAGFSRPERDLPVAVFSCLDRHHSVEPVARHGDVFSGLCPAPDHHL